MSYFPTSCLGDTSANHRTIPFPPIPFILFHLFFIHMLTPLQPTRCRTSLRAISIRIQSLANCSCGMIIENLLRVGGKSLFIITTTLAKLSPLLHSPPRPLSCFKWGKWKVRKEGAYLKSTLALILSIAVTVDSLSAGRSTLMSIGLLLWWW